MLVRSLFLGGALMMGGAAAHADTNVAMTQFAFVPAKTGIAKGAKVVWTNQDTVPHSVTADDGSFDSGPVLPGKSFTWTFADAKSAEYHCIFHPSMVGSVVVKGKP